MQMECSLQAGSLYIKVKRDADEQVVLQQVTSKLAGHVTHLTVHITKDEWSVSPMGSHSSSAVSNIRTPNINNPLLNKTAAQLSSAHTTKGLIGAVQQSYVIDMSSEIPHSQSTKQVSSSNSNNTLITINEKI